METFKTNSIIDIIYDVYFLRLQVPSRLLCRQRFSQSGGSSFYGLLYQKGKFDSVSLYNLSN